MSPRLREMGWREALAVPLAALGDPELEAMRVVLSERGAYRLSDGDGEHQAVLPGRLRHRAAPRDLPAVGDWVAARRSPDATLIEAVLPRWSVLVRRDPDQKSEQVLVANVDLAVVVMGLDHDFNLRRLERYLTLLRSAEVAPLVLLSKADLSDKADARRAEAMAVAPGVPVFAASLLAEGGHLELGTHLSPGATCVLLGSSGVGKSTLLNVLAGDQAQRTAPVRQHDSRGRHTTTGRRLFALPGGALVIDTPGLRELTPAQTRAGLDESFADLAALAEGCRFRDCRHRDEPGCAVQNAVAHGGLPPDRLAAYHKLQAAPPGSRKRR